MSERLLLDTHVVLWLDSGDTRLHASTRVLIDLCWRNGWSILLSAVSVWEIALFVDTGRVALDSPVDAWVERFLHQPGIEAIPLDYRAACRGYRQQRDPADRLLVASAIELGCPLVTYDERIERFAERHGERYGLTVVAGTHHLNGRRIALPRQ